MIIKIQDEDEVYNVKVEKKILDSVCEWCHKVRPVVYESWVAERHPYNLCEKHLLDEIKFRQELKIKGKK